MNLRHTVGSKPRAITLSLLFKHESQYPENWNQAGSTDPCGGSLTGTWGADLLTPSATTWRVGRCVAQYDVRCSVVEARIPVISLSLLRTRAKMPSTTRKAWWEFTRCLRRVPTLLCLNPRKSAGMKPHPFRPQINSSTPERGLITPVTTVRWRDGSSPVAWEGRGGDGKTGSKSCS